MRRITISDVEIALTAPDVSDATWVGQDDLVRQILAAWLVVDEGDLPLNPRLIGRPGVGKTTLACAAAARMERPVYLFQATADTRPEDLIVTPVLGEGGTIRYVASPLVSAMITGGVAVIDEGNRMSEKAWASLAPLLDHRRYVESIVAGVKIQADPGFRFCTTMNDDASTFDLPEYIASRLLPRIHVDFPSAEEEFRILSEHLPFAPDELLQYVVDFLQRSHRRDELYSVRDGLHLARYALKRTAQAGASLHRATERFEEAVAAVLGDEALDALGEAGAAEDSGEDDRDS